MNISRHSHELSRPIARFGILQSSVLVIEGQLALLADYIAYLAEMGALPQGQDRQRWLARLAVLRGHIDGLIAQLEDFE